MKKNDKIKITSNNKSATKGIMFALGGVGVATAVIVPTMYFTLADDQNVGGGGDLSGQLNELEVAHQQLSAQASLVNDLERRVEGYKKQETDLNNHIQEINAQRQMLVQQIADVNADSALSDSEKAQQVADLNSRIDMLSSMTTSYNQLLAQVQNQLSATEQDLIAEQSAKSALEADVRRLEQAISDLHAEISADEQKIKDEEAEIQRLNHMVVDPSHIAGLFQYYQDIYAGKVIQGASNVNNTINSWYEHFQLLEMGVEDFSMFHFGSSYMIPEGTLTIPAHAFQGAQFLESSRFRLPTSIKTIGDYAFAYSKMPDGFVLPSGVTSIGRSAFDFTSLPSTFSFANHNFTYLGAHALSNAWIGRTAPSRNTFKILMDDGTGHDRTTLVGNTVELDISDEVIDLPSTVYVSGIDETNPIAKIMSGAYTFGMDGSWLNKSERSTFLAGFGLADMRITPDNAKLIFTFTSDGLNPANVCASNFDTRIAPLIYISNLAPSYLDEDHQGLLTHSSIGSPRIDHSSSTTQDHPTTPDDYRIQQLAEQAKAFDGNVDGQEIDASQAVLNVWNANGGVPSPHVHNANDIYSDHGPRADTSDDKVYNPTPRP